MQPNSRASWDKDWRLSSRPTKSHICTFLSAGNHTNCASMCCKHSLMTAPHIENYSIRYVICAVKLHLSGLDDDVPGPARLGILKFDPQKDAGHNMYADRWKEEPPALSLAEMTVIREVILLWCSQMGLHLGIDPGRYLCQECVDVILQKLSSVSSRYLHSR